MHYNDTRSVQAFIRLFAGVVSFIILSIYAFILAMILARGFGLNFWTLGFPLFIFNFWASKIIASMFYVLPEWERMVLLRLGKFNAIKSAGYFIIPPFIYSVADIIDNRIETRQVEATNTLTKDNVPIKVTAAIEFLVEDPKKAVIDVQNYRQSVIWLATEALKNTIGNLDLKEFLNERDQIALSLKEQIDKGAFVYGVDVKAVRITDIDTPETLVEELAIIARSRRAARAKKIQAEAEVDVANKIAEASEILQKCKGGIRLREIQAITEMSKEESSMVIIYPYGDRMGQEIASASAGRSNDPKLLKS